MFVLGLMGSPRKKGNTNYLLTTFLDECRNFGAETEIIDVPKRNIKPCMEYLTCEKNGTCPIKDEMEHEIIPLLRKADLIILATPMFFYSCSAQLKTLIDRTQLLWARKYRLKITDPGRAWRKGFLLALGATKGKNLFEGMIFTAKYFYDAVGAKYEGGLTYRQIEFPGDMEKHPTVQQELKDAVKTLLSPLLLRKRILFLSNDDSCLSQAASSFLKLYAGDRYEVFNAGIKPSAGINTMMIQIMQERGIDMEYRKPESLEQTNNSKSFDSVIITESLSLEIQCNSENIIQWDFHINAETSSDELREICDQIDEKIKLFISKQ